MNDPEELEARLRAGLQRRAGTIEAPPGAVAAIVQRSRRRRTRHRSVAVAAVAGAGAMVLGTAVVTRPGMNDPVTVDAGGGAGSTTTAPPTTSLTTWATGPVPSDVATTSTALVPPDSTPATTGPRLALLPDPNASGLLNNGLRIVVDQTTGLAGGQEVTITGSGFPPGLRVGFAMCTTDGMAASTLQQAAASCDLDATMDIAMTSSPIADVDGRFTVRYWVRRTITTIGGKYDCAEGNVDAAEAQALHEQGLLGGASFPPGARGCSVVAVATDMVPVDGGTRVEYVEATAVLVDFDPGRAEIARPPGGRIVPGG